MRQNTHAQGGSRDFERRLMRRREEIAESIESSVVELTSLRESRMGTNADDEHDPEGSTLSTEWSRIAGLRSESAAQLDEVDRALARIHSDVYGACVACGRQIPLARLRVRPWAERCVECASRES